MNNKDLIKQYADSGVSIPEYQYKQFKSNDLKTYARKRVLNHIQNTISDENNYDDYNNPSQLTKNELNYLKPFLKDYINSFRYFNYVLSECPELYKFLTPKNRDKIHRETIMNMLKKNASVLRDIDDIDERVEEFDFFEMEEILEGQPELLNYFLKINGDKLSDGELNYFKERYKNEQ